MKKTALFALTLLTGATLGGGVRTAAQDAAPTLNQDKKQQQQQAQPPTQPNKPADVTPLTLDSPAPVNAEEEAAIKAFRDTPLADPAKKDQVGEDFVAKYPQSRYRSEVYSFLVRGYLAQGQVDKMETVGDKEIELNGNDAQTLAIVGFTLPRVMPANSPDPQKRLDKAESYCKRALDLIPTLPKPADLTDADFLKAKDQTSALAYSGLGLVAIRRQKYAEAIPNFEQAVKLDTTPDPVNYYLLGVANQKTSHFDDAVTAFTKCAALPGNMQDRCKAGIDESKKLGATQLNAPK
jgi:tetratricopeptide (TPR) repeat protein